MNMSIISIRDLSKRYVTDGYITMALDNISLEIEKGEMVSIMGPSGSGKSTLLNILGCLDNPTTGKYIFNNKEVDSMGNHELATIRNKNIGFIFQQFVLIDEYTVYENVELPLIYRNLHSKDKISKKEIKERVLKKLEELGILQQRNKYPEQLSGGQQQRVAIARALALEPEIIIADEPTGALDQKTGQDVMSILSNINNSGKTVIIVTHDDKVAAYCKRKIHIVDGKIVKDELCS